MKIIVEAGDEATTGLCPGVYEFRVQNVTVRMDHDMPRMPGLLSYTFNGDMGRVPLRDAFLGYRIPHHIADEPRHPIKPGRTSRMILDDVSSAPYVSPEQAKKMMADDRGPVCVVCGKLESHHDKMCPWLAFLDVTNRKPVHDELHPPTNIRITRAVGSGFTDPRNNGPQNVAACAECAGTGLWENPANGRRSPCSRGCKAP